jgi:hypothetical protein
LIGGGGDVKRHVCTATKESQGSFKNYVDKKIESRKDLGSLLL